MLSVPPAAILLFGGNMCTRLLRLLALCGRSVQALRLCEHFCYLQTEHLVSKTVI